MQEVRELTGGADFTLECSGRPAVLRQAIDSLGILGTCVIVGATREGTEVAFNVNDVMIPGRRIMGIVHGSRVPPRAQAAHQQADFLYQTLLRQTRNQKPRATPYVYRDYGSLVSVGMHQSVGTLMRSLRGRSWFVRGSLARLLYVSLHILHHGAVLGWVRTAGLAVARMLIRRNTALVKLH